MKKQTHFIIGNIRIILFAFLFVLQSCQDKNTTALMVDFDEYNDLSGKETRLSEITKSYRVIKLETSPDCLLGTVKKIVKNHSSFFVRTTAEELIMFDNNGNFIRKFGKKGKGPGEYVRIQDFAVNMDGTVLAICHLKNILFYDIVNGSFIKKLSFDFFINSLIFFSNEELLVQTTKTEFLIAHVNTDGQILKTFGAMNHVMELELPFEFMKLNNSNVIYRIGETCDIYQYTPSQKTVIKTQLLDSNNALREFDLNNKLKAAGPDGYMSVGNYMKNYYRINYYKELESNYLISYFFEGKRYVGLYNWKNKNKIEFIVSPEQSTNLIEDVYLLPTSILSRMSYADSDDNTINVFIYADAMLQYFDSEVTKKLKQAIGAKEMNMILNSTEEEDNPLIIEYSFKEI